MKRYLFFILQFMKKIIPFLVLGISIISNNSCSREKIQRLPFTDSKPYARYWWFASIIKEQDVRYNLDWLKANGFGGVEVAWVYPLNRFNPLDTTYTPRQEWLSPEWTSIVDYTVRYADSIGLGCDLTFGTLWPFGDTRVTFEQATRRFGDDNWRQEITRSWEHPRTGYVIDHLTPLNYMPYFERLMKAFPRPGTVIPQSYFIDSWEVETEKLWSEGFGEDFLKRFGYDISLHMDSIYEPGNEAYLYDYMSLLSDKVIEFYHNFDSTLNAAGVISRGQVSGAPCDLISGYSELDIPEGEAMLFEPEFCAIPASAALLSGKKLVSSETFTCLYGWPDDYLRKEQAADLKLVADALFSNGINQIVWHGKPHNPRGYDTVSFYATVHVGPEGKLSKDISRFNNYLEKVSSYMKRGTTLSDIAVYLPTEDAWRSGRMPKEKQFIWAWGWYEMRYIYFPDELAGYNPSWINSEFLEKAAVNNGTLKIGDAEFKSLYIDADFLDYEVVNRLNELKDSGFPIILKKDPQEPGTQIHNDYNVLLRELRNSKNVYTSLPVSFEPMISAANPVQHWCRKDSKTLYVFFPNPKANRLKFPIEYGQSLTADTIRSDIEINYDGNKYHTELIFEPYQSLLYRIENCKLEKIDINFIPEKPAVKSRPSDYLAPWLVR
jgi:hypothetical protein